MLRRIRCQRPNRRGAILVLTALLMMVMVGFLAFAIDLGYLQMAKCEMQRTADSSAMAACWELVNNGNGGANSLNNPELLSARTLAESYAAANKVCSTAPGVDANLGNATTGDVVLGYLSNPSSPTCQMTFDRPGDFNAVQIRIRRTSAKNGEVPYFFGKIFGQSGQASETKATAALLKNFKGFQTPSDGGNIELLPFALDKDTWDAMLAGGGTDNWSWDVATSTVKTQSDGVREINLYPQGTGSPGNRGTVDIGPSNNSTADLARQILHGISPADMDAIGGKLEFNSDGQLFLNGDTGISAGVKDELNQIRGQPRIIPIYTQVAGPGNNAMYTIVQFVGIRIMEVNLTGKMSSKRVIIQPANVFVNGGIPANGPVQSQFVYSPVWLVPNR